MSVRVKARLYGDLVHSRKCVSTWTNKGSDDTAEDEDLRQEEIDDRRYMAVYEKEERKETDDTDDI